MQYKKLASFAMVAAAGALLLAPVNGSAMAAEAPAAPVVTRAGGGGRGPVTPIVPVNTYVCRAEGDVVVKGVSEAALVAPTQGTVRLTGTGLANLTAAQVLLSVTDSDPSTSPGIPTVETCLYSASAPITLAAPAAPTNLAILSTSLALDAADSGADCPNPPTGNTFSLALSVFSAGGDDAHFTLTTENDPGANLNLSCARQDIDASLPWAAPAPAAF